MKVQIVEPIMESVINPVQVGMKVEHEDGKIYTVTEILKREAKADQNGHVICITWVSVE